MTDLATILKDAELLLREDEEFPPSSRKPWFTTYGAIIDKQQHFVPLFPKHDVFAVPFCGHGESLYLDKEPAQTHLADLDKHIVRLHRFAKNHTPAQVEALKKKNWRGSRSYFDEVKASDKDPKSEIDFVHREVYLRGFSVSGTARPSFRPTDDGRVLDPFDRLRYAKHLWKSASITQEDYKSTFKRLDSAGTLFFADPPYPDSAGTLFFADPPYPDSAGTPGSESLYDIGCPPVDEFADVFSSAKGSTLIITTGFSDSLAPFIKKMYHLNFRWPIRQRLQGSQRAYRTGWIFTNFKGTGLTKSVQIQVPCCLDKSKITYEVETDRIKESKRTPEASTPHVFIRAEWTHPNGHPRCIVCGSEQPISGVCRGVEKAYTIEVDPIEKAEDENQPGPYFVTYGLLKKFRGTLLPLFPDHKRYVELFCGNGEMIWFKDPVGDEILNDLDPEIVKMHRTCKGLSDADLKKLEGMDWVGHRKTYDAMARAKRSGTDPGSALGWFHREIYLARFSKRGREDVMNGGDERKEFGFRATDEGKPYANAMRRITAARDRLKNVTIEQLDYHDCLKKYGGGDTFFFCDPPYPSIEYGYYKHPCPPMDEIAAALRKSDSRWLLITESQKDPSQLDPFRVRGVYERKFKWPRAWQGVDNPGSPKQAYVLGNIFTSYPPPKGATKAFEKAIPERGGVQVWDPDKVQVDADREDLRPLAFFKPMKPAARPTNDFRAIEDVREFATPGALVGGIAVEPKYNGFRVEVQKRGNRVLIFTEDEWKDISGNLPGVVAEVRSLPGDFILDGEFMAVDGDGKPLPRRDLARYRGKEPVDDSGVRLQLFHALYLPGLGNLTAVHYDRMRRALSAFLKGRARKHLVDGPYRMAHAAGQLREHMTWAGEQPGSEGAMLKLATSTYSLGGENDAWAKWKKSRLITAIVYDRHPVKGSPGVYDFFCAVGPVRDSEAWQEVVEIGGKSYTVIGRTGNSKTAADKGDRVVVEVFEIMFTAKPGSKKRLHWFGPPMVVEKTDQPPMTADAVVGKAYAWEVVKDVDGTPDRTVRLLPVAKEDDEQYVLGIVLVPEEEDAQGDIYSHEEVRTAAHEYLAVWRNRGYLHRVPVNDKVDLVESYIAPVDMMIEKQKIKKGTWLAAMHVKDESLWGEVKRGELTGFSIGGSAAREAA